MTTVVLSVRVNLLIILVRLDYEGNDLQSDMKKLSAVNKKIEERRHAAK
jgi:hypothetical protein